MLQELACLIGLIGVLGCGNLEAEPIKNITKRPDGALFAMQFGVLRLQVMSDSVIHVTYAAGTQLPETKSYSVVAKPATDVRWRMLQTSGAITIETRSVRARVDRNTGAVTFRDRANHTLLAETPDGREISPATQSGVEGTLVRQSFVLSPDEGIYGLRQHQQGLWNYRGHSVHLLQENREVGVPVILSSKGYSLLWDNPAVTTVDVGVPTTDGVIRWTSEVGDAIDYYFIYGPDPEAAIRHYRELTGEAPLMPEWMLGLWQSKER